MQPPSLNTWSRIPIARIEDLSDAVLGAGLEATQMSAGELSGTIAYRNHDGIIFSSGRIDGRVTLYGPLSGDMITLGIGVHMAPGTRHWLDEVDTGGVGVFLPGDTHDAHYTRGSIYASATLSEEKLEEEAAQLNLVFNRRMLQGTGIHQRALHPDIVSWFQVSFTRLHCGMINSCDGRIADMMVHALLSHLARPPHPGLRPAGRNTHARIVARAREYIIDHLGDPISLGDIASAAYVSRRTLQRAFAEVLDDTPQSYVRRLRLHRIRHSLASDAEKACTVALISNQWGIGEIGRMSGRYKELFGEAPSSTLARGRA